ncbi:ATP-binding protein [Geobacter sp.]|uniref:ATP-binding protein n=1 Tax=Geobacter sp. TaxID=46610 RepID=UPI00262DDBD5|nr:ATP-binding protein [Geobacter sp.]
MTTNPTILALLRDEADLNIWQNDLAAIPGIVTVVISDPSPPSVQRACAAVPMSRFILLSGRFYPAEAPVVLEVIRKLHPAAEILLVSPAAAPFPAVSPILKDGIRNLIVVPALSPSDEERRRKSPLSIAISSLADDARERISTCLRPGTVAREFLLESSDQKETLIAHLVEAVGGSTAEAEFLRQRAALIADEMIENALYGAPRDQRGSQLFRKGEPRTILPGERIMFRFGFDGENLAMELADGWGSLHPVEVVDHFSRNREREGLPPTEGGLGLFLIWRFIDHLHISISPGRETVVSGHVRLRTPEDLSDAPGFHITTWRACA